MGLFSVPCLCAIGLAGKCFCLSGKPLGALTFCSVTFMRTPSLFLLFSFPSVSKVTSFPELFAVIAFAVFLGKVKEQFELDSSIWEYGYRLCFVVLLFCCCCCLFIVVLVPFFPTFFSFSSQFWLVHGRVDIGLLFRRPHRHLCW